MVSVAILFPGQGSQFVGMGTDLFDLHPELLGERADEILGWSLRDMCLNGPEDVLTRTEHAQPALFALSYALFKTLEPELSSPPAGAAGHSLGEYTALAGMGAFGFETGLGLVARRGRAMAAAADLEPSGMAALIGVDPDQAESVTATRRASGGRLQVANLNAPGQIVVAGGHDDIEWLESNGRELGVRRVITLKVAGAFHSSFMDPAAAELADVLATVEIGSPQVPVWSNTTAQPHRPGEIADMLVRQVVSPVRFAESLANMAAAGIDTFVHVGPGDATAGMARKTVPGATVVAVSGPEDTSKVGEVIGTV